MVPIKDRLRILRESQPDDPTQIEIAQRLGIKPGTYSSWENGIVPKTEMLIKIADLYHVSLDYVAGLSNEKRADTSALSEKFAALSAAEKFAPSASTLSDLLDAMLRYVSADMPCGAVPFAAWEGFVSGLIAALDAAVAGNVAGLVNHANAATVAALEVTKMPVNYLEKREGS